MRKIFFTFRNLPDGQEADGGEQAPSLSGIGLAQGE